MNSAGMMAKYFATSSAIEKVVSEPRLMSSCLPTSTTSISLVGSLSRSIRLPASLAAGVPLFMATPTSAWARAGGAVRAVAAHRHQLALLLLGTDQLQLLLRRRLGHIVVDAGLGGDGGGGQWIVAGDHDPADAHLAHHAEALADAGLDDVLQMEQAQESAPARHRARRAAGLGDTLHRLGHVGGGRSGA